MFQFMDAALVEGICCGNKTHVHIIYTHIVYTASINPAASMVDLKSILAVCVRASRATAAIEGLDARTKQPFAVVLWTHIGTVNGRRIGSSGIRSIFQLNTI